jgi:hypothetical protein
MTLVDQPVTVCASHIILAAALKSCLATQYAVTAHRVVDRFWVSPGVQHACTGSQHAFMHSRAPNYTTYSVAHRTCVSTHGVAAVVQLLLAGSVTTVWTTTLMIRYQGRF